MSKEERPSSAGAFGFLIMIFIASLMIMSYFYGWGCKTEAFFSKDKYCSDQSNSPSYHEWEIRSHEEDRIESEKRAKEKRVWKEKYDKKIACYNSGYDYNESFDIFEDYNLTCRKIAYLNDHLMDNFEKKDGGYIKGSYSGFLSSGHVEGKSYQYINDRVVATGKLIENIEYHVDCENSTNKYTLVSGYDYYFNNRPEPKWKLESKDTTKIDYFTEEEFVMTYVDRCIN